MQHEEGDGSRKKFRQGAGTGDQRNQEVEEAEEDEQSRNSSEDEGADVEPEMTEGPGNEGHVHASRVSNSMLAVQLTSAHFTCSNACLSLLGLQPAYNARDAGVCSVGPCIQQVCMRLRTVHCTTCFAFTYEHLCSCPMVACITACYVASSSHTAQWWHSNHFRIDTVRSHVA